MNDAKSIGGSYVGVEPMGLFWSMKSTKKLLTRWGPSDVTIPYTFKFDVFKDYIGNFDKQKSIAELELQRTFLLPGVQRIPVEQDGLYGTIFVPPGKGPFPGLLTIMPNSRKGGAENHAALLANHGFATFLVYFQGVGDLPPLYNHIRIEYFEKALQYFLSQDYVDKDGVGIYSLCKGSEMALLMASFLESVKAVVCINGSMGSAGGIITYKDFTLPEMEGDYSTCKVIKDNLLDAHDVLENIEDQPGKQIPIEKAEADILMIVGEADRNFHSYRFADIAMRRMREAGKCNLQVKSYPGAGHFISHPFVPPEYCTLHAMAPKGMLINMGGHDTKRHVKAQIHSWQLLLSFFKEKLFT